MLNKTEAFSKATVRCELGTPVKESYLRKMNELISTLIDLNITFKVADTNDFVYHYHIKIIIDIHIFELKNVDLYIFFFVSGRHVLPSLIGTPPVQMQSIRPFF